MKNDRELAQDISAHADDQIFKIITAVSTGTFALSVTYYTNVYFTDFEVWLMVSGWICLIVSVLSNVLSYFYVRESANAFLRGRLMNMNDKEKFNRKIRFYDRASIWGFFLGILIVSLAVVINVIAHNVTEKHYEKVNNVEIDTKKNTKINVPNINSKG